MNLYISAAEYDYHTLLKVAEMAGLAGIIGFHEAGDGYLVTFPQGENVQALIDDYKATRYIHSPSELCAVSDVEDAAKLLAQYALQK